MGANDVVGDLALFIAVDDDFMPNIFNMIQHEVGVRRNNRLAIRRRRNIQRNENYFERVVPRFNDDLFKEHFRMSRASFQALVTLIGNMIEGNRDRLFNLAKKVQVAIWILSKQESFLAVGDRFGIPRSTCHCAFKEMIQTFKRLVPIYITWPNERILLDNARAFQLKSNGFPGIVAAVDGCHIQCRQPPGNANDFYNRKGNHSIILQGICDHRTKFLDIFVGLPGRIHDAQVLRRSPIYASLVNRNNPLLPPPFTLDRRFSIPSPNKFNDSLPRYWTLNETTN